ncbi:kinesin-like protein KIF2C isoform X2 [Salarias fasciatus]|uniref:kinesin-like protein KIF2C isoform X2 n=1 Tax=Salarias fasciatus TaxID=181472 RepID=UPI0011767A07|nr:kinesin-like protein KIF2C isoform X2 [Salarias fasciatus]
MDTNMHRLLVGLSVQISRSDGRVHAATIKTTDKHKSTVMVEWQKGSVFQMKEIELGDIFALNPDLLPALNAVVDEKPLPPPEKKYDSRLRSSRIPTPALYVPRTRARQTCLFDASAKDISVSQQAVIQPDLPPPSVLSNSDIPNQQSRRNNAKPPQVLPLVCEPADENEEPERMPAPPLPKTRRKSMAHPEVGKSNKRMSSVMKPPEFQAKKNKLGEASQPNNKFYEMIQEFRETLEINPLSAADLVEPHRICVCVRKRPLNKQEIAKKEIDVVSVTGGGELLVHEPKQKVDLTKYLDNQLFRFDYSFDETSTNDLVYRFTAKPLVQSIFEGGMATCFAYGQTGSGKTHTMGGDFHGRQQNTNSGIYALAAKDVFTHQSHRRYAHLDVSVYVSFFEIYNGKVFDLLNKKSKLRVLEDDRQQVQVVGLKEVCVENAEDVVRIVQAGSACRTSSQTLANANSSRSHAILQIVLRCNDRASTLHGKFSLVDLAGNERGTNVGNDRNTLVETCEINRSLLALKECIRSLGMNSEHIPFRMSTLTKVLRDSFIGENSKTCMIAMVAPGMASCEYTMNTLRYADRVKELKCGAKARAVAKSQEPVVSSSDEESMDTSVYDAVTQVAELEEKVYGELKRGSEFIKAMDRTSYNIETGLPDLLEYSQKLLDAVQCLQAAIEQEQDARTK